MPREGQQPFYTNCMDFEAKIQMYFDECDGIHLSDDIRHSKDFKPIPYTMPGICYYLGYSSRHALTAIENNTNGMKQLSNTAKRARLRIEAQRNEYMLMGKVKEVSGIFDLKNNFGWKDDRQLVIDQTLTINNTLDDKQLDDRIKLLLGETGNVVDGEVVDDSSTLYIEGQPNND